ncbi:hypothetical protein DYB35_013031 [Aphanomyces astaci]|uniref:Uncharacterized protein n=1 Tax=Aphanomyces astaci TaxID=112090 RepID=A0A418DXM3_APHAT|nr:hypothetical protein DYB35_013031 [Aphanomyces astaci]
MKISHSNVVRCSFAHSDSDDLRAFQDHSMRSVHTYCMATPCNPLVTPEMKVAFRGWLHQDTMRTPKDMLRLLKEALAKQEIALLGNELLPTLQQIQGAVKTIRCKEFGHLSTTEAAEAELAKWVEPERGNVGDANRPFALASI